MKEGAARTASLADRAALEVDQIRDELLALGSSLSCDVQRTRMSQALMGALAAREKLRRVAANSREIGGLA